MQERMVGSEREEIAEREASDWFGRLQSRSISTDELTEFARWRRDAVNAHAYERVEALWGASQKLGNDTEIEGALHDALSRRRVRRWLTYLATDRVVMTVGASFAALVIVLLLLPIQLPWRDSGYRTGIGERSVVQLDDGTRVQLDTNSRVTTHLTSEERRVELEAGQAYFDVRHDPDHPFIVDVNGHTTVTALGTRFDVRRDAQSVSVSLFEGSVAVADTKSGRTLKLRPGQSVVVTAGAFGKVTNDTGNGQLGWRDGRLAFRDTPLREAIAEINRYTTRPLKIVNAAVADQPVSGDFSTTDIDGFASATNAIFGTGVVVRDAAAS